MKRATDVFLVVATFPLWGMVAAVVALVVRVTLGRPVFYVSERAGLGGRVFRFCKFRTMRPGPGSDAERLTSVGRFLRRTSLDELPQLIHVLAGTMSLVGPRPLPAAYLPRYSEGQRRRHAVRPGITGWAQVHGRNALDWDEKFRLDVWYVDHQSCLLDMKILFLTVCTAFVGTGISHVGYDTMYEFKGNCKKDS